MSESPPRTKEEIAKIRMWLAIGLPVQYRISPDQPWNNCGNRLISREFWDTAVSSVFFIGWEFRLAPRD